MSSPDAPTPSSARGKTVLVVDDEPDVRKLVGAMLSGYGYKVLTADNGENAIRIFHKSQQPVDLLLTDVVSPGMSGPMVADRLAESNPSLKVLFMSGYDNTQVVQKYVVERGYALLPKPFTMEQLEKKVREVLESPRTATSSQSG